MNELSTLILVLDGSAALFMVSVLLGDVDVAKLKNSLLRNRTCNRLIASLLGIAAAASVTSPALAKDQSEQAKPQSKHSRRVLIGHVAPKDQTADTAANKKEPFDSYDNVETQVGAY